MSKAGRETIQGHRQENAVMSTSDGPLLAPDPQLAFADSSKTDICMSTYEAHLGWL